MVVSLFNVFEFENLHTKKLGSIYALRRILPSRYYFCFSGYQSVAFQSDFKKIPTGKWDRTELTQDFGFHSLKLLLQVSENSAAPAFIVQKFILAVGIKSDRLHSLLEQILTSSSDVHWFSTLAHPLTVKQLKRLYYHQL